MKTTTSRWSDGTPRSRGNPFDWRHHDTGFDFDAFRRKAPAAKVNPAPRLSPQAQFTERLLKERHGGAYSKAAPKAA